MSNSKSEFRLKFNFECVCVYVPSQTHLPKMCWVPHLTGWSDVLHFHLGCQLVFPPSFRLGTAPVGLREAFKKKNGK